MKSRLEQSWQDGTTETLMTELILQLVNTKLIQCILFEKDRVMNLMFLTNQKPTMVYNHDNTFLIFCIYSKLLQNRTRIKIPPEYFTASYYPLPSSNFSCQTYSDDNLNKYGLAVPNINFNNISFLSAPGDFPR